MCECTAACGVECRVSRGSLRLARVGVYFSQITDSSHPRAAAGGPGPDRDRGPGRVRRSRWIQDLLTDPRPRFNMAATQRSRTGAPPNPPSACLWPGMRPHLASVFKGSSKTRVNIGRPLIRGGTSSATGAVTGALLYSSRRSSRASVPLPLTGGSRPVNEATIYSRDAEYGDPDLVPCRDQHPTSPSRWFTDA